MTIIISSLNGKLPHSALENKKAMN